MRLRCQITLSHLEDQGLIPRDPVAALSGQDVDVEALEAKLSAASDLLRARLQATSEPLALLRVAETFELDAFEQDVLLLALAPAVDATFGGLYGRLKGLTYRAEFDVEVALTVLAESLEDGVRRRACFAPGGRLMDHSLLLVGRMGDSSGDDFLGLTLRLPSRLTSMLLGLDAQDATLHSVSRLLEPTETLDRVVLAPGEMARIVELVAHHQPYMDALDRWGLSEAVPYGRGVVMLFTGPPGTGKTLTARAVANHLGRRLLLVDTSRLHDRARGFQANLDNLIREARLQNAVLFFDECESLFSRAQRGSGHLSTLLQGLELFDGVCVLATNVSKALDPAVDRRVLYRVEFEVPTPSMREAIWRVHLPEALPLGDEVDLGYLAKRFEFTGGYIKNAVLLAAGSAAARSARSDAPETVTQGDLLEAAHAQLRHRLNRYADRDLTQMRLGDLVLLDDVKDQVREIIEAVSAQQVVFREWGFGQKFNKGRGLSALFDGEPGTGKTLSAEIIAAELGLNLYRVNVANVVSKYIGETEKNLTRVFAEARSAQSVLLFDEADSLFSKRVEVKHANDRFANMEVNTLLQLMERYDGLVILTTNLKTSLDNAFERRLSFKVNFPFPEAELRAHLWRQMLPRTAPTDGELDFDLLGRSYELSGGSIKNAVLRAAYRAASQGGPLTMALLDDAAKRECQAAGKLYRVASAGEDW